MTTDHTRSRATVRGAGLRALFLLVAAVRGAGLRALFLLVAAVRGAGLRALFRLGAAVRGTGTLYLLVAALRRVGLRTLSLLVAALAMVLVGATLLPPEAAGVGVEARARAQVEVGVGTREGGEVRARGDGGLRADARTGPGADARAETGVDVRAGARAEAQPGEVVGTGAEARAGKGAGARAEPEAGAAPRAEGDRSAARNGVPAEPAGLRAHAGSGRARDDGRADTAVDTRAKARTDGSTRTGTEAQHETNAGTRADARAHPGIDARAGRVWPVGPHPPVARGWEPPLSPYGPGHRGVDLTAPPGAEVRAAAAGRVLFAGRVAGRGVLSIMLDGPPTPPLRITYEPVDALVKKGDAVAAGQRVATLAQGPFHCRAACLHWGLLQGDTYLNPLSLLPRHELRRPPPRLLPVRGVPLPTTTAPLPSPASRRAGHPWPHRLRPAGP